jgi:hypothetical protein
MITPTRPLILRVAGWFTGGSSLEVLNAEVGTGSQPNEPPDRTINTVLSQLTTELVTERGVDYVALRKSDLYPTLLAQVAALRYFDPAVLTSDHSRKAFWINLYNALILHAVIAYGVERNISDTTAIFDRAAYQIGEYRYSANDIEHGMLRVNGRHPVYQARVMRRDDPRLRFAVSQRDPRIHFALNCAAKSCPPINAYSTDKIESQLEMAAQNFIQNEVTLNRAKREVHASRLFSWYAGDFGGSLYGLRGQANILRFIAPYLQSPDDMQFVLDHAGSLRLRFTAYDWSLNSLNV